MTVSFEAVGQKPAFFVA